MLDDKQYAVILHNAECSIGSIQDTEEYELCAAILKDAKRDLAAMRTPITAEALRVAGWKESSVERIWDYPSDQWDALWQIQVVTQDDGSLERVRNIDGYSINASTMHDLAQLVRLLGGIA